MTAQKIIRHLGLEPLEREGGLFRMTYRSSDLLSTAALPERYKSDHYAGSAIFYLLTSDPESFSAVHRLETDETWHFYLGDPLEMLLLHPSGKSETVTLGNDILAGQSIQFTVPRGVWQGCRLIDGGEYALTGNTLSPAFKAEDFILGDRKKLMEEYPDRQDLIKCLTR